MFDEEIARSIFEDSSGVLPEGVLDRYARDMATWEQVWVQRMIQITDDASFDELTKSIREEISEMSPTVLRLMLVSSITGLAVVTGALQGKEIWFPDEEG